LGPISFSLSISKTNFSKLKNLTDNFILKFLSSKKKNQISSSIILVNFDPVKYSELFKELSKIDENIFLWNTRKPAIYNLKSFKIVNESNFTILEIKKFQKENSSIIANEIQIIKEEITQIFSNDQYFEKSFLIDSFCLWSSIKKILLDLCVTRLSDSIKRILFLSDFFDKTNISAILEWAETGQEEKEIVSLANQLDIETIMLQQGKYPITKKWDPQGRFLAQFSHSLISSKQAVWGKSTKEYAISFGHDSKNLIVKGSPRHDPFFNFNNDRSDNIILLATTGPYSSASTWATPARINDDLFLTKTCIVAQKISGKKIHG